ncbi:MAG: hypothetical protein ACHQF2_11965 [Flavobacteriales bacterium]
MKSLLNKTYISMVLVALAACKKDTRPLENPPQNNAGEVITSVVLEFTDSAAVLAPFTFAFRDTDGPGGNNPVEFDTISLPQNTTWNVNLLLLNESIAPADTISNEVLEEATDHIICYPVSGWNGSIVRTDSDGTFEIGLQTKWKTMGISTGTVTVTLKHQLGVKDGTCAPGETEAEINFIVRTQ